MIPEGTIFLEIKSVSRNFLPTGVRGLKYTEFTAKDDTTHIYAARAYREGVEAELHSFSISGSFSDFVCFAVVNTGSVGPDSSVPRYGLDGPGIESRQRRNFTHPYNGYLSLSRG